MKLNEKRCQTNTLCHMFRKDFLNINIFQKIESFERIKKTHTIEKTHRDRAK